MKYICLGYLEPGKFENMSESERNTMLDECFSYNDELRKNGHLVAEEPLQPANTAVTAVLEERKGCSDRRAVRGNEGAIGWNSGAGSARSESRNSTHFPESGSEVEVWNNRDTSSGGYKSNDERERAATAKAYLAMRSATREECAAEFRNRVGVRI
jgi:hypothetical protein